MNDLVGTIVAVPGPNRGSGVLKFVGQIRGKPGFFGGIELQGPVAASRGKNNGDVDGVRYFEVSQPMTGLFLPWDRLRTANPSLPSLERVKNRSSSSKRDSVTTPTPSRRGSPTPKTYSGHGSFVESSRTFLRSSSMNKESRTSETRSSITSASPIASQITPRAHVPPANDSSAELADLRNKLAQKTRDFERKEAILLELQATVDQLHPVLEEYEKNIEEKDRKLKKQKNDYERSREEWRLSLDLMLSSQQEAENLYEMQISDLKAEIQTLVAASGHGIDNESGAQIEILRDENALLKGKLAELELQLKQAQAENEHLAVYKQEVEQEKKANKSTGSEDNELVELLRKKVEMLTQDVTSMEIVLQDAQAKGRAKSDHIAKLEAQLEAQLEESKTKSQDVANILHDMSSLSLDEWEKEKLVYQATVEQLELKLAAASRDVEDASRESESSKRELAALKHSDIKRTEQMAALTKQVEALKTENSKGKSVSDTSPQAATARAAEANTTVDNPRITALTEEQEKLKQTILDLRQELAKKPSYDDRELTELQNSLEVVERLHREEMATLQKEFEQSKNTNKKMEDELASLKKELTASQEKRPESSKAQIPVSPIVTDGLLPIYKPAKEIDPSQGRDDWCGLCERDGHDSLNCPYENDMF